MYWRRAILLYKSSVDFTICFICSYRKYWSVVKQICDSVAILKAGQIIEQGQVNDLLAKPDSL